MVFIFDQYLGQFLVEFYSGLQMQYQKSYKSKSPSRIDLMIQICINNVTFPVTMTFFRKVNEFLCLSKIFKWFYQVWHFFMLLL